MPRTSDTERRLVKAARGLWHARSYGDVGVSEICEVAGVKKGSFYHFFASKQELALAVIDDHWKEATETVLLPTRATGGTPLAQLHRLTVLIADGVRRTSDELGVVPGCPFGNLSVELSTLDDEVRLRLEVLFADQKHVLRGFLEDAVAAGEVPEGTDTDAAAQAMHAYIEGVLAASKCANDVTVAERLLPLALRLASSETPVETPTV